MPKRNEELIKNVMEIIRHDGRDEMNLVEYPFASLSVGQRRISVINNEWEVDHPTLKGKKVTARWRVTGDPELGLPTPSTEQVYLVLMEITAESGYSQEVHFSQHDLLKRLGWSDSKKSYKLLKECFQRLNAVAITAENCFYNNETKRLETVGFSIIDNFKIVLEKAGPKKQGALPLSYFRWNNIIYQSIRADYIRPLNVEFALSLDRPLSLRLYRYLDKKRYYRSADGKRGRKQIYSEGVRNLCEKHLGMAETPYISSLKQKLTPAHEELIERGFLARVDYLPMRSKDGEKVLYTFGRQLYAKTPELTTPQEQRRPQTGSVAETCKAIYMALPEAERDRLLKEARSRLPDWVKQSEIEDCERMASWTLWELVERDHGPLPDDSEAE